MKRLLLLLLPPLLLPLPTALGCDLCAVYAASSAQGLTTTTWALGLASQHTVFDTLRLDGHRVADPADQRMESTITQLVLSHGVTRQLSLQVAAPVINRWYRRASPTGPETGHERGWGDASLLARLEVLRRDGPDVTVICDLLGGVKFPTGSTHRIAEELQEHEDDGGDGPAIVPSGIHGHDLTRGSGSTDGVLGSNVFVRWRRGFATALLQYAVRQRGDYDYRFANDLTWEIAPGAYLRLTHRDSVGLQIAVSGERKGRDDLAGVIAEDTGIRTVYAGPRITYTRGLDVSAAIGADFAVSVRNTALQLTPDFRLRANATWTF